MTPVLISTQKSGKTIPTPLICPATYVNETINAQKTATNLAFWE